MDNLSDLNAVLSRINGIHTVKDETIDGDSGYECLKCKDTGLISYTENGIDMVKRCHCYTIKQAKQMMKVSGISEEFQKKTFNNFISGGNVQLEIAKTKAMQYVENFKITEHERRNSILFSGQVGSGKTHLGTAICGELMQIGIAVVYMSYRNTVTKIKQKITDEREYDRELTKYIQARVLYIDDLLKGRITESDVNILYEIVNYRYMNNLPFIISTEKSIGGLLDFDEAIGSRIIEMCRGNIIQLQGKELNYRLS